MGESRWPVSRGRREGLISQDEQPRGSRAHSLLLQRTVERLNDICTVERERSVPFVCSACHVMLMGDKVRDREETGLSRSFLPSAYIRDYCIFSALPTVRVRTTLLAPWLFGDARGSFYCKPYQRQAAGRRKPQAQLRSSGGGLSRRLVKKRGALGGRELV